MENQEKVPAFGPEKEEWKANGNYYTAKDLGRMAEIFLDLTIAPAPDVVYDAH